MVAVCLSLPLQAISSRYRICYPSLHFSIYYLLRQYPIIALVAKSSIASVPTVAGTCRVVFVRESSFLDDSAIGFRAYASALIARCLRQFTYAGQNYLANSAFGKAFFTKRHHVMSEKSLDALLNVVAHPFLAKFVQEILVGDGMPDINAVPQEMIDSERQVALDSVIKHKIFTLSLEAELTLTQAFIDPERKVTIGIFSDNANTGYGAKEKYQKAPPQASSFRAPTRPTVELFNPFSMPPVRPNCHYRASSSTLLLSAS